jgi:fructokinase
VVFGEAIWDLFPRRPGEPLGRRAIDVRHGGGAPANVARTLARLGVPTSIVTAVGNDALGEGLVAELRAAGVGVEGVLRCSARTGVTFVDVAANGARSFLFYRHPSADMTLSIEMLADLDPCVLTADWLHVGSSSLAREPSRAATLDAIERARASGAKLSIDVNARGHLWSSREELRAVVLPVTLAADVVKVNEDDLGALGFSRDGAGARALHARRDGVTFFTSGPRGAHGWWGDVSVKARARTVRVVDVTGAGDAFTAGSLAILARAWSASAQARPARAEILQRAVELGCELGSRAVTRLGATTAIARLDGVARRAFGDGRNTPSRPKRAKVRA